MGRRSAWLLVGAAALVITAPAIAEIASNIVQVVLKSDTAVALSAADPTGATNGTGGYPLTGSGLGAAYARYYPTHVWCELETQGTAITGGTLRWWRQTSTADGGWAAAGGFDESIGNIGEKRWASKALKLAGIDTRVYCQPVSVTESGAGLDGGLTRTYGFRVEAR